MIIDESLRGSTDYGYHWDKIGQPLARMRYDPGNAWSATASHEILEMLVDPYGERLVAAPSIDPKHRDRARALLWSKSATRARTSRTRSTA